MASERRTPGVWGVARVVGGLALAGVGAWVVAGWGHEAVAIGLRPYLGHADAWLLAGGLAGAAALGVGIRVVAGAALGGPAGRPPRWAALLWVRSRLWALLAVGLGVVGAAALGDGPWWLWLAGLAFGGLVAVRGLPALAGGMTGTPLRGRWPDAAVAMAAVAVLVAILPVQDLARAALDLTDGKPRRARLEPVLPAGVAVVEPLPLDIAPIVWPVDGHTTSAYGPRFHPVLDRWRHHNGVDLAVPEGTPVRAATGGEVVRATEDALNGRYVVVRNQRVRTAYCHLSALDVQAGERVEAGAVLGRSGMTGRATGPHLHFGVWVDGHSVDPARLRRER